jgi:hypothetical protein
MAAQYHTWVEIKTVSSQEDLEDNRILDTLEIKTI